MLAKLVRRLLDVLPRIVTVVLERPEEKEPAIVMVPPSKPPSVPAFPATVKSLPIFSSVEPLSRRISVAVSNITKGNVKDV